MIRKKAKAIINVWLIAAMCFVMLGPSSGYTGALAAPAESNVFLKQGVIATANQFIASEPPAKAIDGTAGNNSKWAYDSGTTKPTVDNPYWLMVNVGAQATINRFELMHAGAGGESTDYNTKDFIIQASHDGQAWSDLVTVTGNLSSTTTHVLDTPVTAAYFRLVITDPGKPKPSNGAYAARIYEFQAFGHVEMPPTAANLLINAAQTAEGLLQFTGSYTFTPSYPEKTDTSSYKWYGSETGDAPFTLIDGATGSTLVLSSTTAYQAVKFEVTPIDSLGLQGPAMERTLSIAAGKATDRALARPVKGLNGACGAKEADYMAVDGDPRTKWCTTAQGPHELQVDMGGYYNLSHFEISHSQSYGEFDANATDNNPDRNTADFNIELSDDGASWKPAVVTVTNNKQAITTHSVDPTSAPGDAVGRYVRLKVTKPTWQNNTTLRIYEFKALGTPLFSYKPGDTEFPEQPQPQDGSLIVKDSDWGYLDDGSDQGSAWREQAYDDSAWKTGAAPLGYAGSGKGLDLKTWIGYGPSSSSKHITAYFRKTFTVSDPSAFKQLKASLIRDDGAVVYLNGKEVYRINMPAGVITSKTLALSAVNDERDAVLFDIDPSLLVKGENVLAAEVHQNAASSSDTYFSFELEGLDGNVPGTPEVSGQGLLAKYYTNSGPSEFRLLDHKATTIDQQINFSNLDPILTAWTGRADEASAIWTGQLMPKHSEDYTFSMIGDNGFRMWLDGKLVIDHWVDDWDVEQVSAPVKLEAGKKYDLKIEYFENFGGANLYLRWASPSVTKEIVPKEAFFLPADYAGPGAASLDEDGLIAELVFADELKAWDEKLMEHIQLKSGQNTLKIKSLSPKADHAKTMVAVLEQPVRQGLQIDAVYDGAGGLQTAEGKAVGAFRFTLTNRSTQVDYSPIAIAMSLNGDAGTRRGFAWYTNMANESKAPAGILDSTLQVVPQGSSFDSEALMVFRGSSEVINVRMNGSVNGVYASHKVLAEGLEPGTAYDYRVGSGGLWSEKGSFTTEKTDEDEVTFLYMTDSQGSNLQDYKVWANTLGQGVAKFPEAKFLVMPGDLVDAGSYEEQWLDYFREPQNLLQNLPLMPAVGNHEGPGNLNFYHHFNLEDTSETNPRPPGSVYSFEYGPAHVMVLNTGDINWDAAQTESFNKQIEWMRKEVASTDKKWKIVAFHKAIYSVGNHSTSDNIKQLRELLYPVLDELGIDMVLQGHDHTYMRSYQMYRNERVADVEMNDAGQALNPDGTFYLINNSSGTKFYNVRPDNELNKFFAAKYEQPRKSVFSGIQITEDTLTMQSFRSGETEPFDSYSINRTDGKPKQVEELAAESGAEGEMTLSWQAPQDDGAAHGDPIRGYRIYEKNGKLGTNWSVFIPAVTDLSDYRYTVKGLNDQQTYVFVVKAVDNRDNSAPMEVSSDMAVPAAPTGPIVDDGFNTFGWTNVPGFTEPEHYEYSVDGGERWQAVTANPQLVGNKAYAAEDVQVRVKASEAEGRPAGHALRSDAAYTVNHEHHAYAIEGSVTGTSQLHVDVKVEQTASYEGEAYLIIQLLDGNEPRLINAIPIRGNTLAIKQTFPAIGTSSRVKVFVMDAFDSKAAVPVNLAPPLLLQ